MQKSNSANNSNSSPNSNSTKDSSYNSLSNNESKSKSNTNTKAIDIKRIMREFEEEGVILSNPYNETKAIIEVELEK